MNDSNLNVFTFGRDLRWPSLSREIRSVLLRNGQPSRLVDQVLSDIKVRYDRLALPAERALNIKAASPAGVESLAAQCRTIDEDAFDFAKSAVSEICRAVVDLYVERYENGYVVLSPAVVKSHSVTSEYRQ